MNTSTTLPSSMRKSFVTSRRRKTRRRKPLDFHKRRSVDQPGPKAPSDDSDSFSSDLDASDDMNSTKSRREISFTSTATLRSNSSNRRRRRSLCDKYEPKVFQDIIGHDINIKALSNAIRKAKITPLYLFHGPGGTGKTSTAKVFAMASNCESATPSSKPCWSCRGCSRSLYITDLCSGSRCSGFQRIRTLLQSTTFTWSISGFKVFIIEECHMLVEEAWEELLSIVESGYDASSVVFVMITEDMNTIPRAVMSRCQKFSFQKLKDMDINLKLARIVAQEGIRIGRDALRLITTKADGSLREAENILDQLGLIGSRITTSMVQQLVGLVPHNKLTHLLDTALSTDAIKTVKCTRELIASGVQPQAIVSQLASLIADILSGYPSSLIMLSPKDQRPSRNQLQLTQNQSARLCHALKILVETEKQLPLSSDHTTWAVAALLQIASDNTSNSTITDTLLPKDTVPTADRPDDGSRRNSTDINCNGLTDSVHHRKVRTHQMVNGTWEQPNINVIHDEDVSNRSRSYEEKGTGKTVKTKTNWAQISDMEQVWQDILGRIPSQYLKEFLSRKGKLVSLTVSRANAIVHLMFTSAEDKLAAEMSEETISKALISAFGCNVTVNVSLQPCQLEVVGRISVSTSEKRVADPCHSGQQMLPNCPQSELQPCSPDGKGLIPRRSTSQKSASISENSLRPTRFQDSVQVFQGHEASTTHCQQMPPFSGLLTQGSSRNNEDPETDHAMVDKTSIMRAKKIKHRWVSLSSIQQADISVEPYSQDLLFENAKTEKQQGTRRNPVLQKSLSSGKKLHQHSAPSIGLNRSRSCTDMLCRSKTAVKGGTLAMAMTRRVLRWTTCNVSSSSPSSRIKKTQLDLRKTVPTSSSCSL